MSYQFTKEIVLQR